MKGDSLGDRMKRQYEDRTRFFLPRRTLSILRVDGKSFHSLTRSAEKPYDQRIVEAMNAVLLDLCKEVQGACFGYVQSDEASVLIADYATINTEAWFDGNLQKMVSVAASVATRAFNFSAASTLFADAVFDARAFTIPDPIEVENYFIWRQQDATRNSIQSLAQAHFSPKQLHGLSNAQAQELLFAEKGINWNDQPTGDKRGRCVVRGESLWRVDGEVPVFTADRDYIRRHIPARED